MCEIRCERMIDAHRPTTVGLGNPTDSRLDKEMRK